MSTEANATVDRTQCKAWCGGQYSARGVPHRLDGGIFSVEANTSLWLDYAPVWCASSCRAARLPPIAQPPVKGIYGGEWQGTNDGVTFEPCTNIYDCAHREHRGQVIAQPTETEKPWDGRCPICDMRLTGTPREYCGKCRNEKSPPEPAKRCVCPHGPHTTDGKCPIHATVGFTVSGFVNCACAKCSPPVQEAPKAEPVLSFSFTDDEGRARSFATGLERDDASRAYGAWMKAQTGTPYAGPERLPRPQLAADWVDDCFPESGR